MSLPGFTADAAHRPMSSASAQPAYAAAPYEGLVPVSVDGYLVPQFAVCTPCLGLPPGPWCFTVFGHRICLPIPNIGSWKGCCEVSFRWGWPPISISNCGVQRCG